MVKIIRLCTEFSPFVSKVNSVFVRMVKIYSALPFPISDGIILQVDRFDPGKNIQIETGL